MKDTNKESWVELDNSGKPILANNNPTAAGIKSDCKMEESISLVGTKMFSISKTVPLDEKTIYMFQLHQRCEHVLSETV